MKRLTISFGTANPSITLTSYFALTLNSLQFGARADLYAKGGHYPIVKDVSAEGQIYFDALIYFNPFHFVVDLGGHLTLSSSSKGTLAGLGFELRLSGPNTFHISGKAWVTVCKIDIEIGIDHTWGSQQSLPSASADSVAVLKTALEASSQFDAIKSPDRISGVTLRRGASGEQDNLIDPSGGLRLIQRAVPLGVSIQKIGEAQLEGGDASLDIAVSSGGGTVVVGTAKSDFVRGHYWSLSEGERLHAPAFEAHKAGIEISGDGWHINEDAAIAETYAYETIVIQADDQPPIVRGNIALSSAFTDRWSAIFHQTVAVPRGGYPFSAGAGAPTLVKTAFVSDVAPPQTTEQQGTPLWRERRSTGIAGLRETVFSRRDHAFTFTGASAMPAAPDVRPRTANSVVAAYIAAKAA
jgi:hypothetical protein